jgi:hypothetical protein
MPIYVDRCLCGEPIGALARTIISRLGAEVGKCSGQGAES